MGGHAIKKAYTRRYNSEEYKEIANEVLSLLRGYFPDRRIEAIPAYQRKPSFGDLDVLIESDNIFYKGLEAVSALFHPKDLVINSNVISFEYKEFQVDLIQVVKAEFQTQMNYFSYNDLGNFMGRIAKQVLGVTLGHKGLFYILREDTRVIGEILVSTDWEKILPYLGYKYSTWKSGFEFLEDIFIFASSSAYFAKEIFQYESLNYANRIRDKKRPNYNAFLEWMSAQPSLPEHKIVISPEEQLSRLFKEFPKSLEDYEQLLLEDSKKKLFKERFNGSVVASVTNLFGRELGKFMEAFIKKKGQDWIIASNKVEITEEILCFYKMYSTASF